MSNKPGEVTRDFYRRQGAEAIVQRIIQNLQADAVISITLDVNMLERIVNVIEGTK